MNNPREERRRRIVERGSDRIALITGRIQTLPPPSPPPSPLFPPPQEVHHYINDGTEARDDTPASSTLQKENDASYEVSRQKNVETGSEDGSSSSKCDTNTNTRVEPKLGTSIIQKAPTDTEPAQTHRRTSFFTSKRLNSCIVASENTRIICAFIIAFLVVLSYVDYALFGMNLVKSESVVASRPLYIILLTDVTIVLARLLLVNREEADEERVGVPQDRDNWVGAVKLLERGLVVYQAIRGIFIDFSVYAVVVICGLSLV